MGGCLSTPLKCRGIIFDLDDTLIATGEADGEAIAVASAFAASTFGGQAESVNRAFGDMLVREPYPPAAERGRMNLTEWRIDLWQRVLVMKIEGLEDEVNASRAVHDRWVEERLKRMQFIEGVTDMVRGLQADGYATCLVTNGSPEVQRPKLQACGASDLFGDRILVGGEEPFGKPHPSIFFKACKMMDVGPHETVVVGDSLSGDIQGGINARLLATIWIATAERSFLLRHQSTLPWESVDVPQPTFQTDSVLNVGRIIRTKLA